MIHTSIAGANISTAGELLPALVAACIIAAVCTSVFNYNLSVVIRNAVLSDLVANWPGGGLSVVSGNWLMSSGSTGVLPGYT